MEKLRLSYRKRLRHSGLACVLALSAPHISAPLSAQESVVQRELNRRAHNAQKAHELLKSGDTAYEKRDYQQAVKDYSQAFSLLPHGTKTEEIRVIAGVRYATAATEQARKLAKNGDYKAAHNLLDGVLKPEIAPTHLGALKLKQQIDDPIRYNHALTPSHLKDAAQVGRHLREAEGFFNLAQYDRALAVYRSVLSIDPFNKAARRGMEKISTVKTDYYRAAQDHTRSKMLSQVSKNWELSVPASENAPTPLAFTRSESLTPDIQDRLTGITIDVIDLDNVTISEALDFIRHQSRLGDAPAPNGEQTGINIVFNTGSSDSDTAQELHSARFSLKARKLPLSKALDYITDQTRTKWRTDGNGIIVTPLNSSAEALSSRTFRVPPNFLTSAGARETSTGGDIFGDNENNDAGIIPSRISISEFLQQNGITSPEGAVVTYTPSSNTLFVRNTAANLDLVDQLVGLITDEEPVQVAIKTTIIRVSEQKVEELGFDWAINPSRIGNNLLLGGGTTGNGNALSSIVGSIASAPVTAGLRSGDSALDNNSIDDLISSSATGSAVASTSRAPGILTLSYVGSSAQVQVMIQGLSQKTGADVVVNPSTISRSGERSKIEIVREFIYPTEYEPPELPNTVGAGSSPVTPAQPTAFEARNVGVTLEVEPTVGPNKKFIELSLRPEMVEFDGFINYGSPITDFSGTAAQGATPVTITPNAILMPVFSKISLPNSSVTIQDGQTIVLGGLMTTRNQKVEDKTPLLGDIPYVGRLFRSEAESTIREAIIISVTAELIDPTGRPWRQQ